MLDPRGHDKNWGLNGGHTASINISEFYNTVLLIVINSTATLTTLLVAMYVYKSTINVYLLNNNLLCWIWIVTIPVILQLNYLEYTYINNKGINGIIKLYVL